MTVFPTPTTEKSILHELFYFVEQDIHIGATIVFMCCIFTIIAAMFDMWTAIEAVRASGGRPSSHPMSRTGRKIVDYLRLILFVLMIDTLGLFCFGWYVIPYCVVIVTVGILCREGLSMKENYQLKKSNAVQALDLAGEIVKALTKEDAERLIKTIRNTPSKHD